MLVVISRTIRLSDFDNNLVYFYPGDVVYLDEVEGIAFGKDIHFEIDKNEYTKGH